MHYIDLAITVHFVTVQDFNILYIYQLFHEPELDLK